jgi:hypothetical protein
VCDNIGFAQTDAVDHHPTCADHDPLARQSDDTLDNRTAVFGAGDDHNVAAMRRRERH